MSNKTDQELFYRNQDLFRSSINSLHAKDITQAFLWLRGQAPFPSPRFIHLDLTLRCTAKCLHCQQWTWPDHSEFDVSDLKRLFDIFQNWGVQAITFSGGNPLLYENINLALELAQEAHMEIGIISEGVDLSDELARNINQCASWIRFSLDGPSPEIHDNIRHTPGLFNLVISSIDKLKAIKSGLRIGLNCVIQKNNLTALSQMIDLAYRMNIDAMLFKLPHGDDIGGKYVPSMHEWEQFENWVSSAIERDMDRKTNLIELSHLFGYMFRRQDMAEGKPVRSFYMEEQIRCFVPLFALVCDSEGNIYPCCYLQADNRLWNGRFSAVRSEFCVGNILNDQQQVIDNLSKLLRSKVHDLPTSGFGECGSCTRYCQLNASLSQVDEVIAAASTIDEQKITAILSKMVGGKLQSKFF